MPKYRVVEKSLIGNEVFEEGAIVEYDGLPAENLEPLCAEGRAKYQEYVASNEERIARMHAAYPPEVRPASAQELAQAIIAACIKAS
jgi:hypothetical protein